MGAQLEAAPPFFFHIHRMTSGHPMNFIRTTTLFPVPRLSQCLCG